MERFRKGEMVGTEYGRGIIVGIDMPELKNWRWMIKITDPSKKHFLIEQGKPLAFFDEEVRELYYRVANVRTQQGLWYDFNGNFTGLIHKRYSFCKNYNLPMPYNPELVGWLSATETLEDLFFWFTKEDILELEKSGYRITVYESKNVKQHQNHWLLKKEESRIVGYIDAKTV